MISMSMTITTVHSSVTQNTTFNINTFLNIIVKVRLMCHSLVSTTASASLDMHSLVEETPQNEHRSLLLCVHFKF